MSLVELATDRLRIRRLVEGDAPTIARYRSRPEVARFQSWRVYSSAQAAQLIARMAGAEPDETGRWFQFGIEVPAESRLIGDIGFLNADENGRSWIGFTLDSDQWRRGYAREAVRAVLAHYARLGIAEVWASVDPQNDGSIRLLEALGFAMTASTPDDRSYRITLA